MLIDADSSVLEYGDEDAGVRYNFACLGKYSSEEINTQVV